MRIPLSKHAVFKTHPTSYISLLLLRKIKFGRVCINPLRAVQFLLKTCMGGRLIELG